MNKLKIKLSGKEIIAIFLCFAFLFAPITPLTQKADAFLGINFSITLKDIQRYAEKVRQYAKEVFFVRLKKRMLTQIQNDLVNFVQNGGVPRFIKNPGDFLTGAAETATVSALDEIFGAEGIDICSPFKMNVNLMINETALIPEYGARCTLGDIADNLEKFSVDFNEGGGWDTWVKVQENNLPLVYFTINDRLIWKMEQEGNAATLEATAGSGFLSQKLCNEISVIRYTWKNGDNMSHEDALTITNALMPALGDKSEKFRLDDSVSPDEYKGKDIYFDDVFTPVPGERLKISYDNGITMDKITQNDIWDAKCTDEETITPGQTLSNMAFKALEIDTDSIISSQEIAQILNAVIDAAVNKALKYGLSKMPTKKGSWTTPQTQETQKTAIQTQVQSLESTDAIDLLRKISSLRTNAQILVNNIKKLYGREAKLDSFEQRLNYLGSLNVFQSDGYVHTDTTIDNLYGKGDLRPNKNFNTEENNPGVYLANKTLHEHTAQKWGDLYNAIPGTENAFNNMTNKECNYIKILETPVWNDDDSESEFLTNFGYLPFTDNAGNLYDWTMVGFGNMNYYYTLSTSNNHTDEIRVPSQVAKDYLTELKLIAGAMKKQNEQMAKGYEGLIEGAKQMEAQTNKDIEFSGSLMTIISDYASILSDYDTAGEGTYKDPRTGEDKPINLAEKVRNYSAALDRKLDGKEESGDEDNLALAWTELRAAQTRTRTLWSSTAIKLDSGTRIDGTTITDPEELAINKRKKKIINDTVDLITKSIQQMDRTASKNEGTYDYTILATSVSEAVALAMGIDKNAIASEIESREANITKLQNEVTNEIGKFISKSSDRRKASYDGGESEWEKYFANRVAFVNVNLFVDFYKNIYASETNCIAASGNVSAQTTTHTNTNTSSAHPPALIPAIIKVMPLGDSNTSGYGSGETANSYRQKLSGSLAADTTINYAGGGYYPGWSIGNIQALVDNNSILNANPDIALLMIGTNDMYTYVPPTSTNSNDRYPIYESGVTQKLEKLRQLLISMHAKNPSMNIIVAKISSPTGGNAQISAPNLPQADVTRMFHDGIDGIVSGIGGTGSGKIRTVDMWECGTIPSMSDGLHYNTNGYQCLADKWEAGIKALYSE